MDWIWILKFPYPLISALLSMVGHGQLVMPSHDIRHIFHSNCSHLRSIDLSENMIERLPVGIFNPLLRDGLQIELWMNPIVCDCRMQWFKQWIEQVTYRTRQ